VSIETDRLITPVSNVEDRTVDKALRPHYLTDYIGQPRVREQLEIFIPAAKSRGEALDHMLIFGPPGLGVDFWSAGTGKNYVGVNHCK